MRLLDVSPRFVAGLIVALVLAGVFYVWIAPSQSLPGHPENAAYSTYRPGGTSCDPRRLDRLKGGQADIERGRCEDSAEEYRLKSEDLDQQIRSADAAEAITALTYSQSRMMAAGTSIGFLTLVAAFFAVLYARKAGAEAKRAADAAEDQVAEAQKVTAAELRPYIFVEVVEQDDEQSTPESLWLRIVVKNHGKIPARNVALKRDCYFTAFPPQLRPNVLSAQTIDFPACATERTAPSVAHFAPGQRELWEQDRLVLVIRTRIKYRGIRTYFDRFDFFHTNQSLARGRPFIITAALNERTKRSDDLVRLMEEASEAGTETK